MKFISVFYITLVLSSVLLFIDVQAQDTIIVSTNYKTRLGLKFLVDKSNDYSLVSDGDRVYNGGVQFLRRIGRSKGSIETGVYWLTKAAGAYEQGGVKYDNVSIPFLFRLDTRLIYISGGLSFDYLIAKRWRNESYLNAYKSKDRKFNVGLNLGLGMEKSFGNNFSLFVEGRLANNILSSRKIEHENFGESFTNFGVALGVNYKFVRS